MAKSDMDFNDALEGEVPVEAEEATDEIKTSPEQVEINHENEENYLRRLRARNKKGLIRLTAEERKRIANHIKDLYLEEKDHHQDKCDDIDRFDDVFRMKRNAQPGDDENTPNYRTPLSTVTLEVIHSNIMNVFFTPADIMRVIPTEEGDMSKIRKLDTFGNWSMKNELQLFEKCDRLFHSSNKNGECPYMVHWIKEYGTEVKVEPLMNPVDPREPLYDADTGEPITVETEVPKKLYDGPSLEVFSRKDYLFPRSATQDRIPEWQMRILRLSADKVNRASMEGKYYDDSFDVIGGWGSQSVATEENKVDQEGSDIPLGKTDKLFIQFFGRLQVEKIKDDKEGDEGIEELEDEFIGVVEIHSETLCEFRKNKFPLKLRPIDMDEFIPDDEGRREGTGVIEFMDSIQKSYDALHNQYLHATVQANNPTIFFTPTGNMKNEPTKIKSGYAYPTSDAQSINVVKLPAPDQSLRTMMEEVRNFAQLLFGISDYSAGIESQIDPRAPARKAEIVVAQGNVRLNLIVKRKNKTLKDIFKRWFLLYQANMPPNKFMRIAGEDRNNPWKFEKMNITDFALKGIPDFELTGNILNSNKTFEAQKALSVYNVLVPNPLFNPQTRPGLIALHALTKWLIDKLDETGLSSFLPQMQEQVKTPQEENARMLQGDTIEPTIDEDHIYHIKIHRIMIDDDTLPDIVKQNLMEHIKKHIPLLQQQMMQQQVMANTPQPVTQGGPSARVQEGPEGTGTVRTPEGLFSESRMAGLEGRPGAEL